MEGYGRQEPRFGSRSREKGGVALPFAQAQMSTRAWS
jgi:hypothetical protein